MTMLSNKGYSFNNSYPKNNKSVVKRSRPAPVDPAVIPSMGTYSDKKEAEGIKDLNVLLNLFPKDPKIRSAAQKKLRQLNKKEDDLSL